MLGDRADNDNQERVTVLILVFREDMLGVEEGCGAARIRVGLNPCFSGRYAGSA